MEKESSRQGELVDLETVNSETSESPSTSSSSNVGISLPLQLNAQPTVITPPNKRSVVWQYFGFKDGDIKNENVTCKQCFTAVSHKGKTTTNMLAHLKKKHKINVENEKKSSCDTSEDRESEPSQKRGSHSASGQLKLGDLGMLKLPFHSSRAQTLTKAIGRM